MTSNKNHTGAILYVDVVGFSKLSQDEHQLAVIEALEREVRRFLPVHCWAPPSCAAFIPTGDGFLLTLPITDHLDSNQRVTAVAVALVVHLSKFARKWKWKGEERKFSIRAGLHYDEFHERVDMTGRTNVVGKGLANGQRILSFATDAHFLVSGRAFEQIKHLCAGDFPDLKSNPANPLHALGAHLSKVCDEFGVPYDRNQLLEGELLHSRYLGRKKDKHRNPHEVFNLFVPDPQSHAHGTSVCTIGVDRPPEPAPVLTVVSRKDDRGALETRRVDFVESLAGANELTIVGITNENLASYLESALVKRDMVPWKALKVVFLDKASLPGIHERDRNETTRLAHSDLGFKNVSAFVTAHNIPAGIFKFRGNLPFIGTKYDNDDGTSYVQLTLVLPGKDLKEGFWFEASHPDRLYLEYDEAIRYIVRNSQPEFFTDGFDPPFPAVTKNGEVELIPAEPPLRKPR